MRTILNTQEIFKNSYYVQHDNAIMEIVFSRLAPALYFPIHVLALWRAPVYAFVYLI